jgi:FAD/FMN-containing dehydrogenase
VSPRSPNDVSLIMKTVSFLRSSFSVRSGGHSPNPGFASNNGGILIDLGPLNQTTVTNNGENISVGPGSRWGAVYQALDLYGVTAIGTRIPAVGVGGSILGGMCKIPN